MSRPYSRPRGQFINAAEEQAHVRAREALTHAQKLLPGWRATSRMLARNPKLNVTLSAHGTSMTDGKTLKLKVPIELADMPDHDVDLCGERGEGQVLECPACSVLEEVNITLIHEVAHIVCDTFEETTEYEKAGVILRAIEGLSSGEPETSRMTKIQRKLDAAPREHKNSYLGLAGIISPYLPILINAGEDIRVNSLMQEHRPGTKVMFQARLYKTFEHGVLQADGSIRKWRDTPPNAQAMIAVYCKVGDYDYRRVVLPEVAEALDDPELDRVCDQIRQARNVREVYQLSIPLLENLRRLGFMRDEEDEQDDEPEPEPDQEEQEKEDPGEDAESDQGESDDSGESDTSDDQDASVGDSDKDLENKSPEPSDSGDGDNDESEGNSDDEESEGAASDEESDVDDSDAGGTGEPDDSPDGDSDGTESTDALREGEAEDAGSDPSSDESEAEVDESSEAGQSDVAEDGEPLDPSPADPDPSGDPDTSPDEDQAPSQDNAPDEDTDPVGDDTDDPSLSPQNGDKDNGESGFDPGDMEMGDPDEVEELFTIFGQHEEVQASPSEQLETNRTEEAMEIAIEQMKFFDSPSLNIRGVNEHNFEDRSGAWRELSYGRIGQVAIEVSEGLMSVSLQRLRILFADNARGRQETGLRSGKVNARSLAKRAPVGDDRIFKKTTVPGHRDYFVVIGLDVSGSTDASIGAGQTRIDLIKAAAGAKAELLARLGINFAMYAHSGAMDGVDIFPVKLSNERWSDKTKERLNALRSYSANLDGHTLEYYRKVAEVRSETDRMILYYTDGAMPAANYHEELEILQREIKICKDKQIHLVGVGVQSDAPLEHGLDTILLDGVDDVPHVIKELRKRLI